MAKKIGLALLAILLIIQFFRIDKTVPVENVEEDFIVQTNPPENIQQILKTSCYDCHSFQTKYPWYSNVAPISWWLKDHINDGRKHLNFSTWGTYEMKRKKHKLEECWEEVEKKEMPLESYLYTHGDADLTVEQRAELVNWFKSLNLESKVEAKKELRLNDGKKWAANIETTKGIAKMTEIAAKDIEDGRLSHYVAMGELLNIELNNIFSSCTMNGEEYEQLHLYILPLKDLCDQLDLVADEDEAMILQKNILKKLNSYSNYFE
jgi:hypothetical protein